MSKNGPLEPSQPMANPLLLPPVTLAYVGDAVYELFIRQRLIEQGHIKVGDLHRVAVRYVRAGAQAQAIAELQPSLSEVEQDVVRRGRNAKGRSAPKASDAAEYAQSTSFETLVGYLHLAGSDDRLSEVLEATVKFLEGQSK